MVFYLPSGPSVDPKPRKETEKQVPRSHDRYREYVKYVVITSTFGGTLLWILMFRSLIALIIIGLCTVIIGSIMLLVAPKLVWKDITTDQLTAYQYDYLSEEDQETYREARHNEGNDTTRSNRIRSEDGRSTTS